MMESGASPMRSNVVYLFFAHIHVEPALLIYMISSFLHLPVFQALIYEKSCLSTYDNDFDLCSNSTATHRDLTLQSKANYVFMLSSITTSVPSFFSTVFVGSYADRRSRKVALLIPYVGLVLSDVNYIVQATYMTKSVYYLLIGDFFFGLFGGYSAIISTSFSYSGKTTTVAKRSSRMALLEGCIGIGGTIGYLFSGILLQAYGYQTVFLTNSFLHFAAFLSLCLLAKETNIDQKPTGNDGNLIQNEPNGEGGSRRRNEENSMDENRGMCWWFTAYFRDVITIFRRRTDSKRQIIVALLLAFSVSYLVFSGSQSIMFYYLKHELNWSSKIYGIFRAVYFGSSSAMIIFVFPLLKYFGVSDWVLAAVGLLSRGLGSLMLCFPFSTWFVFCVSICYMFNRFAATGMRAIASKQVNKEEQGKLFAVIALIEAICTLLSSVIFNNLYSATLPFYAGFSYAVMSALMIIPLLAVWYAGIRLRRATDASSIETVQETPGDAAEPTAGPPEASNSLNVRF